MVMNNEYIHLNFLEAVRFEKLDNKVSYKPQTSSQETYILCTSRSLFSSNAIKSSQNNDSLTTDSSNIAPEVVKIALSGIKQPVFDETTTFLNSTHFPKHRYYECLIQK